MNFTTKYSTAFSRKKRTLKTFLVLFVVTMLFAKLGAVDVMISSMFFSNNQNFYGLFSHYPLLGLIAMLGFIAYITASSVSKFFESTLLPSMDYNDFVILRNRDMPVIPNQDNMYEFMLAADKIHNKGAVHLSNDMLNHWNVDQYGNKL